MFRDHHQHCFSISFPFKSFFISEIPCWLYCCSCDYDSVFHCPWENHFLVFSLCDSHIHIHSPPLILFPYIRFICRFDFHSIIFVLFRFVYVPISICFYNPLICIADFLIQRRFSLLCESWFRIRFSSSFRSACWSWFVLKSILFAPIRSHQRSGFRFHALMLFTDFDYIIFGKVTNLFFLVCELESLWPV
jgi:hypothetical protein